MGGCLPGFGRASQYLGLPSGFPFDRPKPGTSGLTVFTDGDGHMVVIFPAIAMSDFMLQHINVAQAVS
jgi:hypothetical protein